MWNRNWHLNGNIWTSWQLPYKIFVDICAKVWRWCNFNYQYVQMKLTVCQKKYMGIGGKNLKLSSKCCWVWVVGLVMARKGKDTDVTVTVKTEEEWNKLIESEVNWPLQRNAKKYICTSISQLSRSHWEDKIIIQMRPDHCKEIFHFLSYSKHIHLTLVRENHYPNQARPLKKTKKYFMMNPKGLLCF